MTRSTRAIVFLTLALAAVSAVAPTHAAVTNGRIAFESNQPVPNNAPGFTIYSINPDGSGQSGPLADDADITPAFSPDGAHIAWATVLFQQSCGGAHAIAVMNADGSSPSLIANRCLDYGSVNGTEFNSPAWSPDGSRLAFMCTNPQTSGENVCLVDPDGTGFVQLTGYANFDIVNHPSWSPDGSQITYALSTDGGATFGVHVMDADGGNDHAITPTAQIGFAVDPAWSPDGTRIAFTGKDGDGHLRIFLMSTGGTNLVQLTPSGANSDDKQPAWSPDGKQLAFASSRTTETFNVYTMNADGSSETPVTDNANTNDEPSWGASTSSGVTDTQPPAVTVQLTAPNGGTPDGQNGWFVTGPVQGTVTANDAQTGGSAVTTIDCGALALTTSGLGTPQASGTFSISSEGVTHISCTATDSAGNTSQASTQDVQLDTAGPTLDPAITPTPILLHGSAAATPGAADGGSGVVSSGCDPVDTSSAGMHTLTCRATDSAGNATTARVGYLVEYRILGFFSPASPSKWKTGRTVPIKIALADANGVRIRDAEAKGLLSPSCRVVFGASGVQSTSACMRYDTTDNQFVFNWKVGPEAGPETITVTVSYPGTDQTTVLSGSTVIQS
jgi:Tol biopolymer transport system component